MSGSARMSCQRSDFLFLEICIIHEVILSPTSIWMFSAVFNKRRIEPVFNVFGILGSIILCFPCTIEDCWSICVDILS